MTEHDLKRLVLVNEKLAEEDSVILTDGKKFFTGSLPIRGFTSLNVDPVPITTIQNALERISILRSSALIIAVP